jgi:outer membrane protein OmpA-like peptidoglycan-associated protein
MFKGIGLATAVALSGMVSAQVTTEGDQAARTMTQSPTMNFVGDRYRVGVGIDSEFDLFGEFQASLFENRRSAFIGEGWLGGSNAGGLKLNYHWLIGGVEEEGLDGPVYTDGHIAKLFLAADQNEWKDRKLTFGLGWERQNTFLGAYGMRALTSERLVSRTIDLDEILVSGQIDGRDFTRVDTLQRITDIFEAPYDWGLGLRGGRFFDDHLARLQGGLDWERGDHGASQAMASVTLEKFFAESPHSVSARVGYARKRGDLVDDRNDLRGTLTYRYSFGRHHHRPARAFREVTHEVTPEPRYEERAVASEVTLSDRATFEFDSSALRAPARETLSELIAAIREGGLIGQIRVVGHTCDIGTAEYNQGLSERRARSVVEYLTANGIETDEIRWEGRGLHDPRYPNDSEENRSRNRRVEISFVTERSAVERVRVSPDGPITEVRQEEVPVEAAWIRRALRNPVQHKREVDVYRYQEVSETLEEGEPVFDNEPPVANDNEFTVERDSSNNSLDVLANDSDPDGDPLTIVSVTQPANGQVSISGNVLLYTPAAGFVGTDNFSYTIDDGFGGQASANVTVNVLSPNQPPEANDVFASTVRTQPVDIDVLANDSDPDGDPLTIVSFTQPANGSVSQVNGLLRYQPDPLFYGEDSFSYTISDGRGGEDTANVVVEVQFANQAPVANPDSASGPAGVQITVDVLANDFDPDGDPIEVISVTRVTAAPAQAVINPDGTISFTISSTCSGFNVFNYTISDPFGATDSATVTITRTAGADDADAPECIIPGAPLD